NPNDKTSNIYGSMGRSSDLHLGGRFYVSDKIGIITYIGLPSYMFRKFGNSLDYTYTLKFRGFYIGTGLAVKFNKSSGEKK
ncbi:MAG TPA: hypothetical protein VII99_01155, partial [Bacteroidia bacterium]